MVRVINTQAETKYISWIKLNKVEHRQNTDDIPLQRQWWAQSDKYAQSIKKDPKNYPCGPPNGTAAEVDWSEVVVIIIVRRLRIVIAISRFLKRPKIKSVEESRCIRNFLELVTEAYEYEFDFWRVQAQEIWYHPEGEGDLSNRRSCLEWTRWIVEFRYQTGSERLQRWITDTTRDAKACKEDVLVHVLSCQLKKSSSVTCLVTMASHLSAAGYCLGGGRLTLVFVVTSTGDA